MQRVSVIAAVLVAFQILTGVRAADPPSAVAHRAVLLAEVESIASPGVPGSLVCVSEEAFPVVLGGGGGPRDALGEPVVAAATYGRGRVVALAHGGYLAASHDTLQFMRNAASWTGYRVTERPLRIGGYNVKQRFVDRIVRANDWVAAALPDLSAVGEADVLVLAPFDRMTDEEAAALRTWVRRGGGLIVASTGWGWQQLNPDLDLATDGPMNRLCAPMGIAWTNATVRDTDTRPAREGFITGPIDDALFGAPALLETLVEDPDAIAARPAPERAQIERTLVRAVRATDVDRGPLKGMLARYRRAHREPVVPTEDAPVRAEDLAQRLTLLLDLDEIRRAAPRRVRAHPAAATFPGAVAPGARATPRTVTVDLGRPRWHSTGLWAVAGRPLTVLQTDGPPAEGLVVRIGCHTDALDGKPVWKRVPMIATSAPFTAPKTVAASAFGGLVYIDVTRTVPGRTATFSIRGAVPAPRYVHGETDPDEWRRTTRHHPAPWGELESDRIILCVPSSELRGLDDPGTVMDVWNRVLDADADLAAMPRERVRPERIVPDVQISAGYMHAGYPIMTHMDAADDLADAAQLLEGRWGLYHELGHNHQSRDWSFGGTGEVTCNLFSLYVYDTVCGKDLASDGLHAAIVPKMRRERVRDHYGDRASFEKWRRDPFLALTMYVELAETFGWDAYRNVFATYRAMPDDQRPKTDEAKRDLWMVTFSKQVGRNLTPFFEGWGIPITKEAKAEVATLPAWEPPNR